VTRAALLAALWLVAPTARAQAAAPALDETVVEPSAGTDLDAPDGPATVPEGYGVAPASPRRGDRVHLDVLQLGDRPLTLRVRALDVRQPEIDGCAAPCVLELEPGRYRFEIDPEGGGPRRADGDSFYVSGERVALQMSYDHRMGLRTLGWTFFHLAGTAVGLSAIGGFFSVLIIGLPIAVAFAIPALPLMLLNDSARVEIAPIPLR